MSDIVQELRNRADNWLRVPTGPTGWLKEPDLLRRAADELLSGKRGEMQIRVFAVDEERFIGFDRIADPPRGLVEEVEDDGSPLAVFRRAMAQPLVRVGDGDLPQDQT